MLILNKLCPGCAVPGRGICQTCVALIGSEQYFTQVGNVESFRCLGTYSGVLRDTIVAAKSGRHDLIDPLGSMLAQLIPNRSFDLVTWVPASSEGKRRRGFDQGKKLAKRVAQELRINCARTLLRNGSSKQVGKNRYQRLHGPDLVVVRKPDLSVILVDDVVTTGASMSTSAKLLKSSGAKSIIGLSLAAVKR